MKTETVQIFIAEDNSKHFTAEECEKQNKIIHKQKKEQKNRELTQKKRKELSDYIRLNAESLDDIKRMMIEFAKGIIIMDKKEIELIRLRAQRAKQENDLKEKREKEKAVKDFLSLITGSCDLNSQIKTQWVNKVFEDFTKPVHINFEFIINSAEFGLTENNIINFKSALSEYLFSLGFAYFRDNYSFREYERQMKEAPRAPLIHYYIEKRSVLKKLFKFPVIYNITVTTVYGK